jgi:thiol-disulfide isomerase/thioredoxin
MSESHFSESAKADMAVGPPIGGRWLVWPWVVLLVAAILWALYQFQGPRGRADAGENHPAVGTRIEQLRLTPLTGGGAPVSADDLQGKMTLINFWGPWCPPCRQEFPHLMEIEQFFRDNERFQFLSISCSGQHGSDEEMGPMTEEFLSEQGADFPTYRDPFQVFADDLRRIAKLDNFVFPTSVVVDQNGVIRGLWQGYAPGDERQIHGVLEKALLATK